MIPTQLTILELYEAVWKTPLKSLAEQWHLSANELGKLLDKHNIPRPPNGYWTKKAVGKVLQIAPLPSELNRLTSIDLSSLQRQGRRTEKPKAALLPSPDKPLDFYPLLQGIKASLGEPSYRYDFILTQAYNDNRVMRLDVSLGQRDRAIVILHSLLSAFDERGWQVKVEKPRYEKRLLNIVTVDNVDLKFRLRERLIQQKRELSAQEKSDKANGKWIWKEKINVPSGKLQLFIDSPLPKGLKSVFEDKASGTLESQLGLFIEYLVASSRHAHHLAEERRISEVQRLAEQSRRWEFESAVKEEQQRIELLLDMASKWQRANQCRKFISEVLNSSKSAEFDTAALHSWQKWSERVADVIDPLNSAELRGQVADIESTSDKIFLTAISMLL